MPNSSIVVGVYQGLLISSAGDEMRSIEQGEVVGWWCEVFLSGETRQIAEGKKRKCTTKQPRDQTCLLKCDQGLSTRELPANQH